MFDIGFFELTLIAVITLLIVGPERLPGIAKTAGRWVGRARSFVGKVKRDIDVEMRQEELRKAIERDAGLDELKQIIDERYEIEDEVITEPVVKAIDDDPASSDQNSDSDATSKQISDDTHSQQAMLKEQDFDDEDYGMTDHSDYGLEEGDPPLGVNPFEQDNAQNDKQEKQKG